LEVKLDYRSLSYEREEFKAEFEIPLEKIKIIADRSSQLVSASRREPR